MIVSWLFLRLNLFLILFLYKAILKSHITVRFGSLGIWTLYLFYSSVCGGRIWNVLTAICSESARVSVVNVSSPALKSCVKWKTGKEKYFAYPHRYPTWSVRNITKEMVLWKDFWFSCLSTPFGSGSVCEQVIDHSVPSSNQRGW